MPMALVMPLLGHYGLAKRRRKHYTTRARRGRTRQPGSLLCCDDADIGPYGGDFALRAPAGGTAPAPRFAGGHSKGASAAHIRRKFIFHFTVAATMLTRCSPFSSSRRRVARRRHIDDRPLKRRWPMNTSCFARRPPPPVRGISPACRFSALSRATGSWPFSTFMMTTRRAAGRMP